MDWFLYHRDFRHERVNESKDEMGQLIELLSEYSFFFRAQQPPVLKYLRDYWVQTFGLILLLIFVYALIFFLSRGLEVDNFRLYDKLLEYIPHTVEYPTKTRE